MKEIINSIDKLTESISKDKAIIEGLYAMFNYKTKKNKDLTHKELYNLKGDQIWQDYVAVKLINKIYVSNEERIIYNNILQKAAFVGNDGFYWAYTGNFNIQPFEFFKIRSLFNSKEIKDNLTKLEGEIYKITNYKSESLMDLQQIDGEMGATIGKMSKGFIFGIYNSNINYVKDGKANKQNLELCHKIVEELTQELIHLGY